MNDTKLKAKISVFVAFLVVLDQLSKYVAYVCLKGKNDFIIIKDVLHLHYLDGGNKGAAWGMLSGKIILFIIFTLIASFFICLFIRNSISLYNHSHNKSIKILCVFLSVLLSGAIGNLIDRVVHGYVIDFIYFKLINFPIFNIADCYVTVSCVVIILICLFKINEEDFNELISFKKK